VDLVIQAHEHSYERLWPVYRDNILAKNYINPAAPVHIISGAAGCGEGIDPMGSPGMYGFELVKEIQCLSSIMFWKMSSVT